MSTKHLEKPQATTEAPAASQQSLEQPQSNPAPQRGDDSFLIPPVTIFENHDGVTIQADLPGVSKDRVQLNCEQDTLTLEGEMSLQLPTGGAATAVQADVRTPRFRRSFIVGSELDKQNIKAEMKDGVLEIRIPKVPSAKPFKIAIA